MKFDSGRAICIRARHLKTATNEVYKNPLNVKPTPFCVAVALPAPSYIRANNRLQTLTINMYEYETSSTRHKLYRNRLCTQICGVWRGMANYCSKFLYKSTKY